MKPDLDKRTALYLLAAVTALGAAFRFYGLTWGTPYYHFHMDEHFVLAPADQLRADERAAAMMPKFFMYSPMMMYLINAARFVFEHLGHPLDLSVPGDEIIYTVLARAIAASFATATIVMAYLIGARIYGRLAGVLSAFLLACTVQHLRDAHFATTDMSMTFFVAVTLWCAVRVAETNGLRWLIAAGAAVGAAVASKYTGAIGLGAVGVAYLLAPRPWDHVRSPKGLARFVVRGMIPIAVAIGVFLLLDPLVLRYNAKFLSDFKEQVTDPLLGVVKPVFMAQFADIPNKRAYWFTNLLWWAFGPALEIGGLAGLVWLLSRRDRRAATLASFPIIYYTWRSLDGADLARPQGLAALPPRRAPAHARGRRALFRPRGGR